MLDHVIIFLRKGKSIEVKNTGSSLLQFLSRLSNYPLSIKRMNEGLEITAKDNLIAVGNGFDIKYLDKYLDLICIRFDICRCRDDYNIAHINNYRLTIPYTDYDNIRDCYSSDGTFLFAKNEYVCDVKKVKNEVTYIKLSN